MRLFKKHKKKSLVLLEKTHIPIHRATPSGIRLEATRGAPDVLAFHLVHIFKNHRAHRGHGEKTTFLSVLCG